MKLTTEFEPMREWTKKHWVLENSDLEKQCVNILEEVQVLSKLALKGEKFKLPFTIGECVLYLATIAELNGYSIEECINGGFRNIDNNVIMKDGVYVRPNIKYSSTNNMPFSIFNLIKK